MPALQGTKAYDEEGIVVATRLLDVVGYFFQVGYEAFHFFVTGGFVWGAQDGRGVYCGHHVGS